ncbi:MAG TPA: oligosaccharide flippase family protein, partial [Emticicia sp.]
MEGKKLLQNTLIYTIGNLGSKLLSFLLLPLFSIYLTPSQFGIYDLILGMINLLVPVVTIQISDATYRWLLEDASFEERKKNISNGFILLTSSVAVFTILFLIISFFIQFEYKSYFFILLIVSCYLPFLQQVVRGLNKSKLYAIVGLINTAAFLILTTLFLVVAKYGLSGILIASIVSSSLSIIFLLLKSQLSSYFSLEKISLEKIKAMIRYSAPLIPNTISWWFINTADKYIILYYLGNEANGIYGLSTRFPGLIAILNSIFMLSWQDYALSANEDKRNEEFSSRIFDHFVRFELSFVIFLISITGILLDLFISPKFSESGKYIPLLFIGSVFSAFSGYLGTSYLKV